MNKGVDTYYRSLDHDSLRAKAVISVCFSVRFHLPVLPARKLATPLISCAQRETGPIYCTLYAKFFPLMFQLRGYPL